MAQTALQKALQQIKALYVKYDHLDNMLLNRDDVIQILTALLPYEREIIESAYQLGDDDANRENIGDVGDRQYINKKDYFITTYNIQPK